MSFWARVERRLTDIAGELLPDEFKAALDAARSELSSGQIDQALSALEGLVEERPEHQGARALLGFALLEAGRPAEAKLAFDAAAERGGAGAEIYLGRAEAQLRTGDLGDAAADFRRAQGLAGGDRAILSAAYRGIGLAHRQAGELDKAVRELRKAIAEAPRDGVALAALGDALVASGRSGARHRRDRGSRDAEARRYLLRATESIFVPVVTYLALGQLALGDGDGESARGWFVRAKDAASERAFVPGPPDDPDVLVDSLCGVADAELLLGNPDAALEVLVPALERAPPSSARTCAMVLARMGDAKLLQSKPREALECFERALDCERSVAIARRALAAAVAAEDDSRASALADDILAREPEDAAALVTKAKGLVSRGEVAEARALLQVAAEVDRGPDAHLALAELTLAFGRAKSARSDPPTSGEAIETPTGGAADAADAARFALAALARAPREERARAVLANARAREFGLDDRTATSVPTGELQALADRSTALYELCDDVRRVCGARPDLADLGGEAARAGAEFDQPLLVTVMGEFSSGKSTFVNAFIGEDVAPTGITPTTSTINIVKYGRERKGRILYRTGHAVDVAWSDLFRTLRALDADAAKQISHVEILLPLETLTQVSLVDTPGFNSILPEHEEVARGFIARADAVIWLFSAQQAGKASEREALGKLSGEGLRVLGVLNKADQLDAGDLAKATAHVRAELGPLCETVVPVSARVAVENASDASWVVLRDTLEQRFFSRARDIKHSVLHRRMTRILDSAATRTHQARTDAMERADRGRQAVAAAHRAGERFVDEVVARERRTTSEAAAHLYRSAAREVLELVVPRKLPFGSHKASRADRDYLVSLLDSGFSLLLEESRARVDRDLSQLGNETVALALGGRATLRDDRELERALGDAIRILDAQVYTRTLAYIRGYLEGGTVDHFFRRDLPSLNLSEDAIYHALFRDSPDLDAIMTLPLAEGGTAAIGRVSEAFAELAARADTLAYDLEIGVGRALEILRSRLASTVPPHPAQ